MKKIIMFGVCLTSLVLLIAPSISAQEYTQVKETFETMMQERMDQMIISLEQMDISTESIQYKEGLVNALESMKISLSAEPAFLGFILSTLISLFFALLGTIFGVVFGPILAFVVKVLTAPAVFLAKIISFLLGETEVITV